MFYSEQLLARKAPLGQIWMAATLKRKIKRKALDKLDIIKICDEILEPSEPMALRLSGILMGGLVSVYQRKVNLLVDDLSRILVDINGASKMDHTLLPKGKSQAKYEAVTLPQNLMDREVEQPVPFRDGDTAKFRGMCLEDLDEKYVNLDDDNLSRAEHHHRAEAVNITLVDNFESGLAETDVFNRYERFDIADDDTTVNVPSPPRQEDPPQQQEQYHAAPSPNRAAAQSPNRAAPSSNHEEPQQGDSLKEQEEQKLKGKQTTKPSKRKARGRAPEVTVDTQTVVPGNVYQTWLKDPSSLVAKRCQVSSNIDIIGTSKIVQLMQVPPVALMDITKKSTEICYPKQLMQLFEECTESKSAKPSSAGVSRTPASSSGGSGREGFLPLDPKLPLQSGSARPKRRQLSSGKRLGKLDPVQEEFPLEQEVRDFKLRRLSNIGATPDLLEEFETESPRQKQPTPPDEITETIHSYLKVHFDTIGAPQAESLSYQADGMSPAQAAVLFYQICVLASMDRIQVTQVEPYRPILISRGPNM